MPVTQQVLLRQDKGFHFCPLDQVVDAALANVLAVQRVPTLQAERVEGILMFLIERSSQRVFHVDKGTGIDIVLGRLSPVLFATEDARCRMFVPDR
ncbi:hypothetical protein D3C77_337220 [compost metagenome]